MKYTEYKEDMCADTFDGNINVLALNEEVLSLGASDDVFKAGLNHPIFVWQPDEISAVTLGDINGDGSVTEFHSLLLRGGSMADLDLVRDSFASRLMIAVCPELYPQNVRYTSVYINGEYYGIYAWREAYSEQYFGEHTGTETDEVTLARGPVTDGELWDLINYIIFTPC